MHIKYAAAVTIVALAPEIACHSVWDNAIGDADPSCRGFVIGKTYQLSARKGTDQIPFQQDIPVLKNPIVPPTAQSKWWKKPRTYWVNGCGATILDQNTWYQTHKDPKIRQGFAKLAVNRRNPVIYQVPVKKMLDWNTITKTMAKSNQIVKVSAGGWIRIMHYQVNADGAGPFRCKISSTGQPNNWNAGWIYPPAKDQVPGDQKAKSLRAAGTMQLFPLTITIPKNIVCRGTYEGKPNICMMRCENFAINGPFGGCLPFQLIPAELPPPPPPPPDNSENIGKTTEADKVKLTDEEEKEIAAEAPEEVSDAKDPAVDVKAEAAATTQADIEDDGEDDEKDDGEDDEKDDGEDDGDDAEEAATKRLAKRQAVSDDEAVAIALGGEAAPPAIVKALKAQMKKTPASQKSQLKAKLAQGKAANKANKPAAKPKPAAKKAAAKPAAKKKKGN